jgi:transposase-like protein
MAQNLTPVPSLTSRQRKAVDALLGTGEVKAAAAEVGISRETLHRWLKQPAFSQAVKEAEAKAIDDLSRMLVRLGRTATATLAKAMTDASTPMSTRVRAADVSLSRLLQLRELATLEARVTELERSVGLGEAGR